MRWLGEGRLDGCTMRGRIRRVIGRPVHVAAQVLCSSQRYYFPVFLFPRRVRTFRTLRRT
eukprot:352915-Chlamydomonas_euryale.AAC.4